MIPVCPKCGSEALAVCNHGSGRMVIPCGCKVNKPEYQDLIEQIVGNQDIPEFDTATWLDEYQAETMENTMYDDDEEEFDLSSYEDDDYDDEEEDEDEDDDDEWDDDFETEVDWDEEDEEE